MKIKGNLVQFTSYLSLEQYKRLKRLKDKTRISMADLMREAIDNLFKRYKGR